MTAALAQRWHRGPGQKALIIAASALVIVSGCCSSALIFDATPLGQRLLREAHATETVRALSRAQATATMVAYALAHPTSTPFPTAATTATAVSSPTVVIDVTPTAAPSPTATALPTISLNSPILGGSWQAFDNLFGDNNCCYLNGWDYQGSYGPTFTGTVEASDNATSQPNNPQSRVTGVDTQPQQSSQTWSTAQEQAMQGQFMPPDAQLKRTKPVFLGNLIVGSEKIYNSVLLARSLPASDFKDANGNPTQPGTIYVNLAYHDTDQAQFDQCALGTDESFVLQPF